MSEALFAEAYDLLEEFYDRSDIVYKDGDRIDIAMNLELYNRITEFVRDYK